MLGIDFPAAPLVALSDAEWAAIAAVAAAALTAVLGAAATGLYNARSAREASRNAWQESKRNWAVNLFDRAAVYDQLLGRAAFDDEIQDNERQKQLQQRRDQLLHERRDLIKDYYRLLLGMSGEEALAPLYERLPEEVRGWVAAPTDEVIRELRAELTPEKARSVAPSSES